MDCVDDGEFKEGVSLTAFDELLRWEKYSYGCSELVGLFVWMTETSQLNVEYRFSTPCTSGSIKAHLQSSLCASCSQT